MLWFRKTAGVVLSVALAIIAFEGIQRNRTPWLDFALIAFAIKHVLENSFRNPEARL